MKPVNKDPIPEFIDLMSFETLQILYAYMGSHTKDKNAIRVLSASFVSGLISHLLKSALTDFSKKDDKKKQLAEVKSNFTALKREFETQVAEGFNKAMFDYTGQDVDYYCQIKQAPEVHAKSRILQ